MQDRLFDLKLSECRYFGLGTFRGLGLRFAFRHFISPYAAPNQPHEED